MPLPKLIALDLDGTLLMGDGKIGERSRCAIRAARDRGSEVVLCTGRPPRGVSSYAHLLDLPIAIVFNGASIVDFGSDEATHLHQLDSATVLTVLQRMRKNHPGVLSGMETSYGWFLEEASFRRRRMVLEAEGLPLPDGVGPLETLLRDTAIKLLFRHEESDAVALSATLADIDVYCTWSGRALLEVQHAAVNKRWALERFAADRGVDRQQVAAFGDAHNDCEMLRWAGRGVAMANGSAAAHSAADTLTASNDDEGVAQLLEVWLRGSDSD